jgi:hypothetical protein
VNSKQNIRSISTLILITSVSLAIAADDDANSSTYSVNKTLTATVGTSIRFENPDPAVLGGLSTARVGLPAGQLSATGNAGSSDLNFEKNKPVSTVLKAIGSLELTNGQQGVFIRAKAWHDYALTDDSHPYGNYPNQFSLNNRLSDKGFEPEAKFSNARFVDAYVYGTISTQDKQNFQVKVGQQFLNWGSSYFFNNGVNIINPINYPGLVRPGATAEESRLPIGMAHLATEVSGVKMETFYQYGFTPSALNGCGTFYTSANYVQPGCNYAAVVPGLNESTALATGLYAHRAEDDMPKSRNQFGIASHFALPELQTKTHLYFINYHSRTPSLQGINTTLANYGGAGQAGIIARISDPAGMKYAVAYPESIRLFGFSFDTQLQNNTKIFGEVSIRPNQPITLNSADLLDAMLSRNPNSALNLARNTSSLPLGSVFDGFDRFRVTNMSTGLLNESKLLSAAKTITLAEVGMSHISNLPDAGTIRYGRSDDYGVGAINGQPCTASAKTCSHDGYVTSNAWGLRLRIANVYPNAVIGIALTPSIYLSKDIKGYSFDSTFVEGRTMIRLGLRSDWSKTWYSEILINKTSGGDYNTTVDRSTLTLFTGMSLQ